MKRLPLLIVVITCAFSLAVLMPFMLIQWLFGGNDPIGNYVKAVEKISFGDDRS